MTDLRERTSIPSPWSYRREWLPELYALATLAVLAIVVFGRTDLDLRIARWFFDPLRGFPTARELSLGWRLLYAAPSWSVALLGIGAGAVLLAGGRSYRQRQLRRYAIAVLLALALGPGLVVNIVLKDFWGRPRPVQVRVFGGSWEFRQPTQPGQPGRGKSFPCGHSSAGYVGTIFWLILKRRHRLLAQTALAASLLYGTLLGLGRMMTGAHFASDVVWSAILAHGTNVLLYYFLLNIPGREDTPPTPGDTVRIRGLEVLGWAVLALAVAAGALVATPYYTEFELAPHILSANATNHAANLEVQLPPATVELNVDFDSSLRLRGQAQGFGMVGSRLQRLLDDSTASGCLQFRWIPTGWFFDLDAQLTITLPPELVRTVRVHQARGILVMRTPEVPGTVLQLITGQVATIRRTALDASRGYSTPPRVRGDGSGER